MLYKKILLIGKCSSNPNRYTYTSSFYTTLQKLGYQVTLVSTEQQLQITKPFPAKIQNYAHSFYINQQIRMVAATEAYDLIFIIKAEMLTPATFSFLKKHINAPIALFYPDNPFVFWNGNANKNLLLSLPLFDYFLIWSHMLVPAIQSAGAKKVRYFPFAYDEDIFNNPLSITAKDNAHYACDINFIGSWDAQRESWLTSLIQQMPSLKLTIWGNQWQEQLSENSPLKAYWRGPAIYTQEMIKALRCAKITLNFIRQQNMSAHNMRTFEALASKAFMLTERTIEQTSHPFQEGSNIECFASLDELVKKIAFYLHNDTLRNSIAHKGYLLAQDFTLYKQLQALLQGIENDRST